MKNKKYSAIVIAFAVVAIFGLSFLTRATPAKAIDLPSRLPNGLHKTVDILTIVAGMCRPEPAFCPGGLERRTPYTDLSDAELIAIKQATLDRVFQAPNYAFKPVSSQYVNITSPNKGTGGGEQGSMTQGSILSIGWVSGNVAYIAADLMNGTTVVRHISTGTSAQSGQLSWQIPLEVQPGSYTVRLIGVDTPGGAAVTTPFESDPFFIVAEYNPTFLIWGGSFGWLPASTIDCNSSYMFKIYDNNTLGEYAGQVWLTQTKNGAPNYDGLFNVPSGPTTTVCNRDEGTYVTDVYNVKSGQKGTLLNSATFTVTSGTTIPTCSVTWGAPTDAAGKGIRHIGDLANYNMTLSGFTPSGTVYIRNKNLSNNSEVTRSIDINSGGGYSVNNVQTPILAGEYSEGEYSTGIYNSNSGGNPLASCTSLKITSVGTITISPTSGPVGTLVDIYGSNFAAGTTCNSNDVRFNGAIAYPIICPNLGGNQLKVQVPAGATTGLVTVQPPGGSLITGPTFTVTSGTVLPPPTTTPPTPTPTPTLVTVSAYTNNLIAILNKMILTYKNVISSIGTQSYTPPATPAPAVTAFPVTATVNATLLNVRSAPNTSANIVTQLPKGSIFTAVNSVRGENVEGTDYWWITDNNTYIWAGGTTIVP